MPKIPLYGQGVGPQVQLATGRLGAPADVGAFTAQARAMTALGQTIGQVGRQYGQGELQILEGKQRFDASKAKVDFDFKMAEKERQEKTLLKSERAVAAETFGTMLIEDTSISVDEAAAKFDDRLTKYSDDIRGRGYTPRFEQLMLQEVENVALSNKLGAQRKAFDTGTKLATDSDNQALDLALQNLRAFNEGDPEFALAMKNVDDTFTTARNENRKLKYTPESFNLVVKLDRANIGFQNAATEAQVTTVLQGVLEDPTIPPGKKSEARKVARARISQMQVETYDATRETMLEASFSASEADEIVTGMESGKNFTVERVSGEVISFEPESMTAGQREEIIKRAKGIGKEYTQEMRNDLASEISAAYDAEGTAGVLTIATNIGFRDDVSEEDAEAVIISQARKFAADAQALFDAGLYDAADAAASTSQLLLSETFVGTSPMRDKVGATGTSANALFSSMSGLMANAQAKRVEAGQITQTVQLIEQGVFGSFKDTVPPKIANAALEQALSGKNLVTQLDILQDNNMSSAGLSGVVSASYAEATGPDPNMESVNRGLEVYRQLKVRGAAILDNHTNQDTQVFFNSVLNLESVGVDTEDAIRKVRMARDSGIDIAPKYNLVKSEVNRIRDAGVFDIFGITISGETISNRAYVQQKLEDLSKIYIGHGQDPKDAVKLAAEQLEASHINLRGMYIPRDQQYPDNLERMADLAAENFVKKNPQFEDEQISIFPTVGRVDEWNVMINGQMAAVGYEDSVYTLQDLEGLLGADKRFQNEQLIQQNLEKRGLTTEDQIRDEMQALNRQANELTGANLSRIRKEQGDAAANEAIAKREQLRSEAELLQQLLVDMKRAERGS